MTPPAGLERRLHIGYPDDIHDFLLWRNWVDAYRATAAFFAREL